MEASGFGIDVGGSGVKGAPVDLVTGQLAAERHRIPTPQPATPKAVAKVAKKIIEHYGDAVSDLPIGITVPAIVQHGITRSAANIDKKWIDAPAEEIFSDIIGREVCILNDADAAGIAEALYGAAKGEDGLVLVTTLGTGIGSALIYDGRLIPNFELGHLEIEGYDAEDRAAASRRDVEKLTWKEYTRRLQIFYERVEFLISPDLIVVGGGISRDHEKFLPNIKLRAPIVPAILRNHAGIVGAAYEAVRSSKPQPTTDVHMSTFEDA
jgi:polyphosphate glucokinase